jgi:predicted phosphodiesterase
MRITWRTEKLTFQNTVKYGVTPELESTAQDVLSEASQQHCIILTDLSPNTVYYYKTSDDLDTIYTFQTAPSLGSTEPFEFVMMGDMHAAPSNNLKPLFKVILSEAPNHAFGIALGDSITDGNSQACWNAFFEDAQDYLIQKPLMNTTGNHDTDNEDKYAHFLQAWHHPFVNTKIGGYYLMEYANAVFFFVDSNNAGGWEPTPSDEQMDWLTTNLDQYAKKDKWIFLCFHHQVYSTGDFGCANIMHQIFRPLVQEYHIDAVFYGHDHHYECFWVDKDTDYGGTLFFVSGSAGGQERVDYSIMGDRDGQTKYIWPGRFLNVRKHGVPIPSPKIDGHALGFRNDEVVSKDQLLGVLEPHFLDIQINGDIMEIKAIGWQKQIFHHLQIARTGCGRHFDEKSEKEILDY